MKVKIFTNYFANEIEDAVNRFLSKKDITIHHVTQSESLGVMCQDNNGDNKNLSNYKNITISIFYTK